MPQREVAIPEVVPETVPEPVAASSSAIAVIVDSVAPVVPAESAPRIPEFAGGFNVNFSFLSENIIKEGAPDYNGGNRGGSGWGSGPFGNGDEENYFPEIPNLLLYSFIYQLFMDRAIISFNKAVSQLEYSLADKCLAVLRKSNPNSLKYRVFKFILGILSCLVAPKVLEFTIKNTANTTSRLIRRVSFPLFRLFLHVLVFAGASVLVIKAISYVVYNMDPTIEKLCSLAWGDYTNPVVLFLELCLKCVIASILTDVVIACFKNFIKISQVLKDPLFEAEFSKQRKNAIILTFAAGLVALFGVYKDHTYIKNVGICVVNQYWSSFLLDSQLGRLTVLLAATNFLRYTSLVFPSAPYIFVIYTCVFRLYILALSAFK